jgi:hypothetical protein
MLVVKAAQVAPIGLLQQRRTNFVAGDPSHLGFPTNLKITDKVDQLKGIYF